MNDEELIRLLNRLDKLHRPSANTHLSCDFCRIYTELRKRLKSSDTSQDADKAAYALANEMVAAGMFRFDDKYDDAEYRALIVKNVTADIATALRQFRTSDTSQWNRGIEAAAERCDEIARRNSKGTFNDSSREVRAAEECAVEVRALASIPESKSTTPLLKKIVEICDSGSAQEFGDADERLRAIRGLIIGEAV